MNEVTQERRRFSTVLALALTGFALSGALAACGSDDDKADGGASGTGGSTAQTTESEAVEVTPEEQSELLAAAFYTDEVENPSPVLLKALKIGAAELTPEQEDLLRECMEKTTCETGQGDLVLGIADSFGDIPWRVQARLEQTAQAIQSGKVAKIIYTNGHADLQQSQSNFRSLIAQRVDIISAYYDFASAMTSLFRQAQRQGVVVTSYISNIPHGDGESDGIEFAADIEAVAHDMASAVQEAHPEPGNAVLFTGVPGNPTAAVWQPVVTEDLEAAGWKISFKGNTNWTPAGELSSASAAIAKGEPIDVILYDGAGPVELMRAFERAGEDMPAVVSWGSGNTYFDLYEKLGAPDDQYITNGQTWTGRVAVQAAIDRASGEEVPGEIVLPQPLVQTTAAKPQWEPTLRYGQAYLPPTFAGDIVTEFNK